LAKLTKGFLWNCAVFIIAFASFSVYAMDKSLDVQVRCCCCCCCCCCFYYYYCFCCCWCCYWFFVAAVVVAAVAPIVVVNNVVAVAAVVVVVANNDVVVIILQWQLLNVITLDQNRRENINRMYTIIFHDLLWMGCLKLGYINISLLLFLWVLIPLMLLLTIVQSLLLTKFVVVIWGGVVVL